MQEEADDDLLVSKLLSGVINTRLTNEMVKCLVNKITVFDSGDPMEGMAPLLEYHEEKDINGTIVIDFKLKKI